MANNIYPAVGLIGGTEGALDRIDGDGLANGDGAIVITDGGSYIYHLDSTSGAAESSPDIISPDANAGDKRWILTSMQSILAQPYDIPIFSPGVLTDGMVIMAFLMARPIDFLANFSGAAIEAGVAATSQTVLSIKKEGAEVGTITFAASGTTGTFASTGGVAVSYTTFEKYSIEAPATADATLADLVGVIPGTR